MTLKLRAPNDVRRNVAEQRLVCYVVCRQIEDAEEEKSSVHLKNVIKSGAGDDGVTTVGFGSEQAASFSASVNFCVLAALVLILACLVSREVFVVVLVPYCQLPLYDVEKELQHC